MARPTKYNEARAGQIVDALRAGCTRKAAAQSAGVDRETFARWRKRYAAFAASVTRAEAEFEVRTVAAIQAAALPHMVTTTERTALPDGGVQEKITTRQEFDWRAAAWLLERRFPKDWAPRRYINVSHLSTEQLLDCLALLDEDLAGGEPCSEP